MSVSSTFLNLQSEKEIRAFLYALGTTYGADHIERATVGRAVVWIDAQNLNAEHQDKVWVQLERRNHDRDRADLLPHVFHMAVLSNTPSALQRVCDHCGHNSDVFTMISRILKNLQAFPSLPITPHEFCWPLLDLIADDRHLKTMNSILCNNLYTRMVNNEACTGDVLQCVVNYTVNKKIDGRFLAQLLFSLAPQWKHIANHSPQVVQPLIAHTPFENVVLLGNVNDHASPKWEQFLQTGVPPLSLDIDDSGYLFNENHQSSWLSFLDEIIPLYQLFGLSTPLESFQGLQQITRLHQGVTVNEYQRQKLNKIVAEHDTPVLKVSKI